MHSFLSYVKGRKFDKSLDYLFLKKQLWDVGDLGVFGVFDYKYNCCRLGKEAIFGN
jgi:hypothetical protein